MKQPKITDIVTEETISLAQSYIAAKAIANVLREQVDEINCAVLQDIELYADLRNGERIIDPARTYLTEDDEACARYFAECDRRQRTAGIKPADMNPDFCPALVAEDDLRQIENALINATGKPFGVDNNVLLCSRNGLAKRQEWLDLNVKMILAWIEEHR